jgi:hypothetical protein
MSRKPLILFIASFVLLSFINAQNKKADSVAVSATFTAFITACKAADIPDIKASTLGKFYKAAVYVVYRGTDKKRKWKDFVQYENGEERMETDRLCKRVIRSVILDNNYKVTKYFIEKEFEGTWHVLIVNYKIDKNEYQASFAFLKIGKRFGIGDIDQNYQ